MITSSYEPELDLTIHVVTGSVTAEELGDRAAQFMGKNPSLLSLWDFSHADISALSADGLRAIFNRARPYAERRRGGRTALVFSSAVGFGMGRMAEAFGEAGGFPYEFRSFWDRDAALIWLGSLDSGNGNSGEEPGIA